MHAPSTALRRLVAATTLAILVTGGTAHAQAAPPAPKKTTKAAPATKTPAEPKAGEKQLSDTVRKKARYHMDFDKVDILEVIKFISQWTNKNFILPDNVRGKITIIGPTDVTADEAYAAFLASLETNNLTISPTGKFLKIVPKKDSIRTSIPTYMDPKSPVPLDERMVTKLFRIRFNDVDPIKNVLQQFITREGEIVPYPPDVLIISDNGLNITRLERLLEQLDQPGAQDEVNVLQVDNAPAQEVANLLTQIFQQQGQPGAGGRKGIAPTLSKDVQPVPAGGAPAGQQDNSPTSVTKVIPDERTNKIIVIASSKSFQRIKELVSKIDVPTDTGQVHVYYLENADAEELAGTLSALASGQSSGGGKKRGGASVPGSPPPTPGGGGGAATSAALFQGEVKVTAEKGTNSLLIIASPSDYRNMVKVIQQLDMRRRQVFIEAVIMEVKLNSQSSFNIDTHGGYAIDDVQLPGTDKGVVPIILGSEVSNPGASLNLAGLASMNGFIAGLQGPPIKVSGFNINLPSFGVVLNALQTNSDVNVISTPHLLTSDNEEAEIEVGSQVPFQTAATPSLGGLGGLGGLATSGLSSAAGLGALGGLGGLGGLGSFGTIPVQRQPVTLHLKVKPHVNESDFVKLELDQQVEEIASVDQRLGPTTSKRSIKTTVVAKDQTTVVIGGLIQDRQTRAETKVPILGSIPIIGKLFRSEDTIHERTNLLLFLTPYVIRDQADFRRIFERKMKERQEFVARFFGTTEEYAATIDYDRKHGPLAVLRRGVKEEFDKAENGGPGSPGEKVITPKAEPVPVEQKPAEPPPPPKENREPTNPDETPVPPIDDLGGGGPPSDGPTEGTIELPQ